jgi:thiol-activated cytolysin
VLFAIESSEEYEEVSAALDAAFSSGAHSGDLQVSVEQERLLRSSSIKGTIIGGSGSDAAGTINGLDAMETFLEQGGNYSQDSPGAPISYKLRFLKDLSVAKIILMSEYEVRDCTLNVPDVVRVRVTLNHIRCDYEDDEGSHEEFYGYLGSAAHYEEPEIIPFTGRIPQVDFHYAPRISGSARLWEADSNAHVSLASGDSWPSSGSVADAVYEFEEPNRSLAYVVVEGHLYDEDDNSGDDDLTYQDATVFLRDIEASPTPVTKTLHFSRGATRGSAQFELSLVQ